MQDTLTRKMIALPQTRGEIFLPPNHPSHARGNSITRLGKENRYLLWDLFSDKTLNEWEYFGIRASVTHLAGIPIRLYVTAVDKGVTDFSWNVGMNVISYGLTAIRNPLVESLFRKEWTFDWKKYFDSHDQSTAWQVIGIPAKLLSDYLALTWLGIELGSWGHRAFTFGFMSMADALFTISARLVRNQGLGTGLSEVATGVFLQKAISASLFADYSGAWFFILDKAVVGTPLASYADARENWRRMVAIKQALQQLYGNLLETDALKKGVQQIFHEMTADKESSYKDPEKLRNYIREHYPRKKFRFGKIPFTFIWWGMRLQEFFKLWRGKLKENFQNLTS